jgi:chemotaxis protein CheD
MKMIKGEGVLITYALGSCIGICLYDKEIRLGALVHIMLPINMEAGRTNTMKYADTGLKETIRQMELRGAKRARLTAKIAGGAKMFDVGGSALGNIGQRNIESVKLNLKKAGVRLIKEDVGGTLARTLLFDVANGNGSVRCFGRPEMTL